MTKAVCLLCAQYITHWNQLWRHTAAIGAHMKAIGVSDCAAVGNSHAVSPLSPYPPTASGFKTVPRAHRFITQFLSRTCSHVIYIRYQSLVARQ